MMRAWLSPSNCVKRKLSTLDPAKALMTGVPTRIGPPGAVKLPVDVIPSGIPPVEAGLKYGALSALSISTLNSADHEPRTFTRLTALKSNHVGFLETVRMNDIERLFAEGTNVTHGSSEALTNKGRQLTKRQMPY